MAEPRYVPRASSLPDHLAHLHQRCGSCRHWGTQYELGTGYCELPKTPDPPMRASEYNGIVTRIDFGCLWWEPAEPVARKDGPAHACAADRHGERSVTVDYRTGQVLDQLAAIPDGTVDLVTTSPPFLALRDYNGQAGQWGSEPDPASFLDHLLELTAELRRVLAPHGSIAIELGDTYSGSGGAGGDYAEGGMRESQAKFSGSAAKRRANGLGENPRPARVGRTRIDGNGKVFRGGKRMPDKLGAGWPGPKSLCGTPTLYAWSLAYGRNLLNPGHTLAPWLVRNVIVWARNNPPVGALSDKVRPATSYITVATPSPRRWFDLDAVRRDPVLPVPPPGLSAPPPARAGRPGPLLVHRLPVPRARPPTRGVT